jgi:hypothetical protein
MSTNNVAVVAPSDGLAFAEIEQVTADLELYEQAREMFLASADNMIELLLKWVQAWDKEPVRRDIVKQGQRIIFARYKILAGMQTRRPSERVTA